MEDFNIKVEQVNHTDIVGNYGLGERNERGEILIEFCQRNKLFITNMWFQHPPRNLILGKVLGIYIKIK